MGKRLDPLKQNWPGCHLPLKMKRSKDQLQGAMHEFYGQPLGTTSSPAYVKNYRLEK